MFTYNLKQDLPADTKLVLTIADDTGRQVRQIELDKAAGLKRVVWNLRGTVAAPAAAAAGAAQGQRGAAAAARRARLAAAAAAGGAPLVSAGRYTATLGKLVGDKVTAIGPAQSFRVVTIPQ